MTTQRTNLLNFLRATCPFSTRTPTVAKFTGWMVSGIHDSADLFQEAHDAYGMGADGLMELLVDYATLAASCYERLEGDPRFSTLVDERERNVETRFLWVIEEFGQALAELARVSGPAFDILDGNNLLFRRITDWLIPETPVAVSNNLVPVPGALYLDVLNYLESCCETERHNPEDPCHRLLSELDEAGNFRLVEVSETDKHDHLYVIEAVQV